MNSAVEINAILHRIVELLSDCNYSDWSVVMNNLSNEVDYNTDDVIRKIVSLYGGMNSFNDLVLQVNGKMLVSENIEFDRLKNRLHELCVGYKVRWSK